MLRLRRYRVFVAFAIISIFVFYHFSQLSSGRRRLATSVENLKSYTGQSKPAQAPNAPPPPPAPTSEQKHDEPPTKVKKLPATEEELLAKEKEKLPDKAEKPLSGGEKPPVKLSQTIATHRVPPESDKPTSTSTSLATPASTLVVPPGLDPPNLNAIPIEPDGQAGPYPIVHWESKGEHFPVPSESIRPIPTVKPRKIPRIQFGFTNNESKDQREQRKLKLDIIKEALNHTWSGYKQKAWMHDEVMPVTGNFKDPFCGWAATLVDTLDTLWIMGLKEEFEEAVNAVNSIDFTTTQKEAIPMFETTIRYLGGLLSAYDISGKKYNNLLSKAVELAEILMGAFDTPNRMPVAFYYWKPAFASQPHRASQIVLAEIGSLSLEFTRLAQLTKQPKYYDAVARITDALEKWQMQTVIPGLWPLTIDASGCDKISTSLIQVAPPLSSQQRNNSKDWSKLSLEELADPQTFTNLQLELPKNPDYNLPSPAASAPAPGETNRGFVSTKKPAIEEEYQKPGWASLTDKPEGKGWDVEDKQPVAGKATALKKDRKLARRQLDILETEPSNKTSGPLSALTGKEIFGDADCKPQGLASPWKDTTEEFGIGGRADSTYEYLPKQFLLLGGEEDQYRTMYTNAVDAIRKHLLFTPHVPGIDKRKILVSGTLRRSLTDKGKITPEMTHLTCFAGGMFAIGAKIFDRPLEMEFAERLTDGCVWAYEATKSGIMPETAYVDVCNENDACAWNETQWHEALDPHWRAREEQARVQEEMFKEAEHFAATSTAKPTARPQFVYDNDDLERDYEEPPSKDIFRDEDPYLPGKPTPQARPSSNHPKRVKRHSAHGLEDGTSLKEGQIKDNIKTGDPSVKEVEAPKEDTYVAPAAQKEKAIPLSEQSPTLSLDAKKQQVEAALNAIPTQSPDQHAPHVAPTRIKSWTSLSHKEFVDERLENEHLPGGFTRIMDNRYILRPEAIESVWIMYRVTGNQYWREKGWEMFKSIQAVTRTEFGFSAVADVMGGASRLSDSMESFWSAETLKYFYLLFSDEDVLSLDEWVL
ncbi:MAG: hypothetical protein M1814_001336 [Vezdaea aestivalis]|nr:MAG: hypothetical protein M1814_001336 [Vezdaea aestivalis]